MSWWWVLAGWLLLGLVVVVERIVHRHMGRQAEEALLFVLGLLVVVACWPSAYVGPWLDRKLWERKHGRRRRRP